MFRHTILQSKDYSRRLLATRTAGELLFINIFYFRPLHFENNVKFLTDLVIAKILIRSTSVFTFFNPLEFIKPDQINPLVVAPYKQKKTSPPKISAESKPKKTKSSTKTEQSKISRESLATPEQIFACELPAAALAGKLNISDCAI